MVGYVREDCFGIKLSLILGIMNSTDRREEKRNFLIQGRCFRRSFKNYCNYWYFMTLTRLLLIVKLGIDVLLSDHLQSRCIDSLMYRYTPNTWRIVHIQLKTRMHKPYTIYGQKGWKTILLGAAHTYITRAWNKKN